MFNRSAAVGTVVGRLSGSLQEPAENGNLIGDDLPGDNQR